MEALARGIELFNRGQPYEAHEAWEERWVMLPRDSPERALLQGLIHLAAAALKAREGAIAKAQQFVGSACGYLERARDVESMDVPALIAAAQAWANDVTSPPPPLTLVALRAR
jgi:predicted metal-dependent hydrolase